MLFEGSDCAFGHIYLVIVGVGARWMPMLLLWMWVSTALEHSLSMTLSVESYQRVLRVARISLKAAIIAPSVLDGMARTRMALRS